MFRAFIINLDRAPERWSYVQKSFAPTSFALERVPGIDGDALELPMANYAEKRYRWRHGRPTSRGHVGCYLSHMRAMEAFLATDDPHALIGEDDLSLGPDFEGVVAAAVRQADHWNVLRLTGLSQGKSRRIAALGFGYELCVNFGRLKGTGAYLLDRRAARALLAGMLPMWLPIDHAIDREWCHGLRANSIRPFPASQVESGFRTSIHRGPALKLSARHRWLGTFPYQAYNEVTRLLARGRQYLRARGLEANQAV